MLQKLVQLLVLGTFLTIYPPLSEFFELPKVVLVVSLIPIMYVFYSVSIALKPDQNRGISQLYVRAPILLGLLSLFVFACAFSSVMVGTPTSFFGLTYQYQGVIFFACLALFSYVLSKILVEKEVAGAVSKAIVLGASTNIGLIILQCLTYVVGMSIYTAEGRMTGLIGNPNFAGGAIALSYPYLFYYWREQKMKLAVATLGAIIAVILTDSRGALLGLTLAMLLVFAKHFSKKIVIILALLLLILGAYFYRQRTISDFDSLTSIWQKEWHAFQQKPIFGWGMENFHPESLAIRVDTAHNEFLEKLVATGVVGASLYLAVIVYAGWVLWKHRADEVAALQLVCMIVFVVLAQVNVLNVTEYLFLFIALGVAAHLDAAAYGRSAA